MHCLMQCLRGRAGRWQHFGTCLDVGLFDLDGVQSGFQRLLRPDPADIQAYASDYGRPDDGSHGKPRRRMVASGLLPVRIVLPRAGGWGIGGCGCTVGAEVHISFA